jgi:hypothetical protein
MQLRCVIPQCQFFLSSWGCQRRKQTTFDWVDELQGVDEEDGVLEDLGFHHPGFPRTMLLYRFRNPVLPAAIAKKQTNSAELALRILTLLERTFRLDTRAMADLYLRLAERAGARHEGEQHQKLLSYWSAIRETEMLARAITHELN